MFKIASNREKVDKTTNLYALLGVRVRVSFNEGEHLAAGQVFARVGQVLHFDLLRVVLQLAQGDLQLAVSGKFKNKLKKFKNR